MFEFLHSIAPYLIGVMLLVTCHHWLILHRVGREVPVISRNREAGLNWWSKLDKRVADIIDGVYGSKVQRQYIIGSIIHAALLVPVAIDIIYTMSIKLFN